MASGRELDYDWSWELPASAEALWPLVSDTNRFNRDAGLPPVEDVRTEGEELPNARRRLRLTVKGVTLEWEELPFEWLRPWRFGVVRRYSKGPLEEMRVLADLEELGPDRTRLRYRVAARPRGLLGLLTTPLQIGVLSRLTFGRVFKRYARAASEDDTLGVPPTPPKEQVTGARLDRAVERLEEAGVLPAVAGRLVHHVASSDDLTVARIRPYALAQRWAMERRTVLRACLLATRAGVLNLSWDIMCPVCRGAKERADTLRRLRTGMAHCDTCQVDFSPDFDQAVEVSFSPTEAIRSVDAPPFCVAGPQISPHVEVQQLLGPGEERRLVPRLREGRHRARAFGIRGGPFFQVEPGGAEEVELRVGEDGWAPAAGPVAPEAALTLVNDTGTERLLDVERTTWADTAATAAEVTAMAEFRDLFQSEVLAAGDFVQVGSLAVLFTDLKGSTRLYRRIGDAPAFGRVMGHFDVLDEAVRAHDGTVVKTIGDAVMAVFRDPGTAVRAALRARRALRELDPDDPLVLKAGVHYGPCIAVTLNERLDYFGTTVNVAARLGDASRGDLVFSGEVGKDPAVGRLLEELEAEPAVATEELHGLDEPVEIWRLGGPGGRTSDPDDGDARPGTAASRRTPDGS